MAEKKMWGGRFSAATVPLTEIFTESVSYDSKLYRHDIAGSIAHAHMLAAQGVLQGSEADAIVNGLQKVRAEIDAGGFEWRTSLEDVHMNIESRLTELIGDVGKKLHTGRSRNDQVALSFRLYTADALEGWKERIKALVSVLVKHSELHRTVLLPGYTHLQAAQPVSLAQHLLAYAWMLKRDYERVTDALKRIRVSPLGAAALAGTTYPLDPAAVADEVGFDNVFDNSMDAVSDRDFAVESLFCASLCMAHLSRLCEDIILWANSTFGFVALPDGYSTGSSIMPQKKNPDVAELVRGKTGRVYGALMALLTVIKGLPMTYNRDLQEDKEQFFMVDDTLGMSLEIMAGMLAELRFDAGNMRKALSRGYVNATELADYLVGKGVPFREAHHITGRAVAMAEGKKMVLDELSLMDFQSICNKIDSDVYAVLTAEAAVGRRQSHGGTGPASVDAQLKKLRAWLG